MTGKVRLYLGLGSNLGDRQAYLDKAVDLLSLRLKVEQISSVYETEPLGSVAQPRFLNLVVEASTGLSPEALLALTKGIEKKLGRTGGTGQPRPIDIDILLYGDKTVESPELTVPHPRLAERAFVLVPLAEIAPKATHPVTRQTAWEMLKAVTEKQGVFKWEGE